MFVASGSIVDCKNDLCRDTQIHCSEHEDCSVQCSTAEVCSGSTVECPNDGNCAIDCLGSRACAGLTVNARFARGHLDIRCDADSACRDMRVYGSILDTQLARFSVQCSGKASCVGSEIQCARNSDCHGVCLDGSCSAAVFNGQRAFKLTLRGHITNLTALCPPNANCLIDGLSNAFSIGISAVHSSKCD